MSANRYCPVCGTQNEAAAQRCARCGLEFAAYKPAPVPIMEGGRERPGRLIPWLLGGLVVLVAVFAAYILSVQRMIAGGDEGSALQELAARSRTLLVRLQEAQGEADLEGIHREIGAMLAILERIPEGGEVGDNLLLQRTLYEMDAFTRPGAAWDTEALQALRERLAVIGRPVRASSPPTP